MYTEERRILVITSANRLHEIAPSSGKTSLLSLGHAPVGKPFLGARNQTPSLPPGDTPSSLRSRKGSPRKFRDLQANSMRTFKIQSNIELQGPLISVSESMGTSDCIKKGLAALCVCPEDSGLAATGGDDGFIIIWDFRRRIPRAQGCIQEGAGVTCLAWSVGNGFKSGGTIAAGLSTGETVIHVILLRRLSASLH